jgi:glycosyltransferase involved in cell wall biosynthesis
VYGFDALAKTASHGAGARRRGGLMRLLYLCPDYGSPSGGIRVIYRHVDVLRRNGYEAFVVHERQGFRCRWFDNETPILGWSSRRYGQDASMPQRALRLLRRGLRDVPRERLFLHLHERPSFDLEHDDVVVIPEMFGPQLAEIAPGIPKVIFNQNVYFSFKGYPADPRSIAFPYRARDVVATLVVSEDSKQFIQYAFPDVPVHRVRWSIDPFRFHVGDEKERRIAYMPRRGAADAAHVLTTLAARNALDGYEIVRIEGVNDEAVAQCLRQTLIFLSLGYHEGLPLPPAEAMACGAIVVGYDGFGGREYMLPEFSFPVPTADLMQFATTLEHVLALHEDQPERLRERSLEAAAFIAEHYSPQQEERELLSAWSSVLRQAQQ